MRLTTAYARLPTARFINHTLPAKVLVKVKGLASPAAGEAEGVNQKTGPESGETRGRFRYYLFTDLTPAPGRLPWRGVLSVRCRLGCVGRIGCQVLV